MTDNRWLFHSETDGQKDKLLKVVSAVHDDGTMVKCKALQIGVTLLAACEPDDVDALIYILEHYEKLNSMLLDLRSQIRELNRKADHCDAE